MKLTNQIKSYTKNRMVLLKGEPILAEDLFLKALECTTTKELSKYFPGSPSTIARAIIKEFPELGGQGRSLKYKILLLFDLKECTVCKEIQHIAKFNRDKPKCIPCEVEYNKEYQKRNKAKIAKRKANKYYEDWETNKALGAARANKRYAAKLRRTPSWANLEEIQQFYLDRPEGYHVDHIIPLQGDRVSGLHVIENLQYLTSHDNFVKHNTWDN